MDTENAAVNKSEAIQLVEGIDGVDGLKLALMKSALEQSQNDAELKAQEKKELILMRGRWSTGVFLLLIFIIVTDTLFIYAVGLGWLHFENSFIIPTFIGEGLIKTIGLAYIIVRFLFNKDSIGE